MGHWSPQVTRGVASYKSIAALATQLGRMDDNLMLPTEISHCSLGVRMAYKRSSWVLSGARSTGYAVLMRSRQVVSMKDERGTLGDGLTGAIDTA